MTEYKFEESGWAFRIQVLEQYVRVSIVDDKNVTKYMTLAREEFENFGRWTLGFVTEHKQLKTDLEIMRKASRLFEQAANDWMDRALKAEANAANS